MPNEFINPNWHVVIMHYPLGLLTIGVLIELFSFLWPRSTVRTAGRWAILIGALLTVPAVTLGLYAFRDVVTAGPIHDEQTLMQVKQASPWTDAQWTFMKRHLLLTSVSTGLFLLAIVTWLGASDDGRRKLRLPLLLVLLAGLGLMLAGAWYSGEAVYQYGTAVERVPPGVATQAPAPQGEPTLATMPSSDSAPAGMIQEDRKTPSEISTAVHPARAEYHAQPTGIKYYIPPLQLHLLLAGLTVAAAFAALGASFRRWARRPVTIVQTQRTEAVARPEPGSVTSAPLTAPGVTVSTTTATPAVVETPVYAARYWLLACMLGVGTALAGLWSANDWDLRALLEPLRDPGRRTEIQRLFFHVISGSGIVVLTLLLALITRVARRGRGITLFFVLLLLLAVAVQVWLGILLLFDSVRGPLTGFNVA